MRARDPFGRCRLNYFRLALRAAGLAQMNAISNLAGFGSDVICWVISRNATGELPDSDASPGGVSGSGGCDDITGWPWPKRQQGARIRRGQPRAADERQGVEWISA